MMTLFRPPCTRPDRPAVGLTLALLLLVATSCAGGPPPVFQPNRAVSGELLLMEPAVRLGSGGDEFVESTVATALERELRGSLAGNGIELVSIADENEVANARAALVEAVERTRLRGRRLRSGSRLAIAEVLPEMVGTGARSALMAVLSRSGMPRDEDQWVPRPADEIIPLPEDRPDYEVPMGPEASGRTDVTLDVLLLDVETGEVVMHRRVFHPADTLGAISEALPVLVREAVRGVRRPAS
jgi:hypothetical protein